MPRLLLPAGLMALCLLVLGGAPPLARAADAPTFAGLETKVQKDLAEKARAYFDPTVEFLWRPRKEFVAVLDGIKESLGGDPLSQIPLMREIAYQGRHFGVGFDDRKWQKEVNADYKKTQGLYENVKSEEWRFTYTVPRRYPRERELQKVPRPEAFPLLVALHEYEDTKSDRGAEEHPGEVALSRLYPKDTFEAFYDNWLTLAPVAARGQFVEDGRLRHVFLTLVLTEFWRRYHVDFDRIVIDGGDSALALAAVFPHVFAGLVVRGGEVKPELVRNFASVPVFVVKDEQIKKALEDAGHPDVTLGTAKDVGVWLNNRKRVVPSSFEWRMINEDHQYANWITLLLGDAVRTLKVTTDREQNRIQIDGVGVSKIQIFLNDEIVDLDKEVTLVLNGQETVLKGLQRDFGQMFDKDPYVRRNMNFGWLYPVMIDNVDLPERETTEETPPDETAPPTEEPTAAQGTPEEEAEAQKYFDKGAEAEAEGDKVKALTYYKLARDAGDTSLKAKAEERITKLEGGG